jgi:hypothetical protein
MLQGVYDESLLWNEAVQNDSWMLYGDVKMPAGRRSLLVWDILREMTHEKRVALQFIRFEKALLLLVLQASCYFVYLTLFGTECCSHIDCLRKQVPYHSNFQYAPRKSSRSETAYHLYFQYSFAWSQFFVTSNHLSSNIGSVRISFYNLLSKTLECRVEINTRHMSRKCSMPVVMICQKVLMPRLRSISDMLPLQIWANGLVRCGRWVLISALEWYVNMLYIQYNQQCQILNCAWRRPTFWLNPCSKNWPKRIWKDTRR